MRPCLCLSTLLVLSACSSPPPAKAPKTQADSPRIKAGNMVEGCKPITQVRAVYPKDAKEKRIQGTIQGRRTVALLPCVLNSEPVEVKAQIDINFTLNQ